MRHRPNMLIRILLFIITLASFAIPSSAQSTAIQPCEAAPSTAKPGVSTPAKTGVHTGQTAIDSSIPEDDAVEKMLAPYSGKVRALNVVNGRLQQPFKKDPVGAGLLGCLST